MSLRARWNAAARLVTRTRDVLDARPGDPSLPAQGAPLALREWAPFLQALSDERLEAFEARGRDADWSEAPRSLATLVEEIREVCALPALAADKAGGRAPGVPRRLETPRKRAQVEAFAAIIVPLASKAARIVDVGSGHGHLTRAIAERIALPVVGLERDEGLARRARTLRSSGGDAAALAPAFAVTDVLRDGLRFASGDCAIGLHACGELGDAMVEGIGQVDGHASIALVGCCLQKRRQASRRPMAAPSDPANGLGSSRSALDLPRAMLGLSNLTARDDGVEATRSDNLAARERRLALHRLLSARTGALRFGAEIDGLNRRAAHGPLVSLVARAFGRRGMELPSKEELDEAGRWARVEHARARRLSLPRSMLARVLEVFVLLDRGVHLEERGFDVTAGTVFEPSVSARNLALVGRR